MYFCHIWIFESFELWSRLNYKDDVLFHVEFIFRIFISMRVNIIFIIKIIVLCSFG